MLGPAEPAPQGLQVFARLPANGGLNNTREGRKALCRCSVGRWGWPGYLP